ncbi:hypothetical protein FZEAL_5727 [Fusarium zealandicum]|uniref:Prolyl 4-hydroxylase alpha subunit Fe(2+) 2OG dioxygenase domain-containing protein n=1 Tax=Fusarium zealandicum TaxID=1053134 RepID=A0A8H4XJJ0_9HYPO|nr:hypothetical protein FZEAL_5727 [Fusarium zealandicum]
MFEPWHWHEYPDPGVTLGSGAQTPKKADTEDDVIKKDLLKTLQGIKGTGSFASFAHLTERPPAGLFVPGVGNITMPLSEVQACQLIAKARQAPFGKGSDTVVDTAVRNTWELNAEQFKFRDLKWAAFIQSLCKNVAHSLGINTTVRAEIYKMLIYEKGAMFKAHTDTEKIPGMFGTLLISLPSVHQGGDLVLKHCGETKVFKTSGASQSFACWYSDVSHEVLPVTSGYRWVLTYNLALDQSQPRPSAGLLQQPFAEPLRQPLLRWLAISPESRESDCFYHVLEHDYTEANSSLKALKARDLLRVQALKEVCSDLPVDIFLALLEKEEQGIVAYDSDDDDYGAGRRDYYDDEEDKQREVRIHPLQEIFDKNFKIKTLVDLEGRQVGRQIHFDEQDLLDQECFEGLEYEEEYESYTGNTGPTATHRYRVTAVAIVPRGSIASFLSCEKGWCSLSHDISSQIGYFARRCLEPQAEESLVATLRGLLDRAWGGLNERYGDPKPLLDGEVMSDVLKAAMQLGLYQLFEKTAGRHEGHLPFGYFTWVRQWLVEDGSDVDVRFNAIKQGISSAIDAYPWFADQTGIIKHLAPRPRKLASPTAARTPDCVLEWAREEIRSRVGACASKFLGPKYGPPMVDLAFYFDDPSAFLSETIAPLVEQKGDTVAFSLDMLARLQERSTKGRVSMKTSNQLYRKITKSLINFTDFAQVRGEAGVELAAKRIRYTSSSQPEPGDIRTCICSEDLAELFSGVIQVDTATDNLAASLSSRLSGDVPRMNDIELHTLWMPFLQSLTSIIASNNIPLSTEYYQKLFSTFLKAYLDKFLGKEPVDDQNMVRSGVRCSCIDCENLNIFLADPARVKGRFSVNKQRRQHLHQKLEGAGVDFSHDTDRSTRPQTLEVTKTFEQVPKKHENWSRRRTIANKKLMGFNQDHLRLLLGLEYSSIVNMEHIVATGVPAAHATTSEQNVTLPPIIGHKRALSLESDLIDLASD